MPVQKKPTMPIWTAAGVFIIAAIYFDFYNIFHFMATAAIAALVGWLVSKKAKPVTVWVDKPKSGIPELDEALAELSKASKCFDEARPIFFSRSTEAANYLSSMKASIDGMYKNLTAHPEDLKISRKFIAHYLPMVLKMVNNYTELAGHPEVDNVASSMRAIEGALISIDDALKRQLDAQFANDNLDIATDIEVLNTVLGKGEEL